MKISIREKYIGNVYNFLEVIDVESGENYKTYFICKCLFCDEVDNYRVRGDRVKSGYIKSCGCWRSYITTKRNSKHGLSKTRIMNIYRGMVNRCKNKSKNAYYGKDVSVCACIPDFITFYNWSMANGYADDLTIERVNNDGNYCICTNNLTWETKQGQARNRGINSNNKSGKTGVHFVKHTSKWQARITDNDKNRINLGYFENIEEAVKARKEAEIKYWGKGA